MTPQLCILEHATRHPHTPAWCLSKLLSFAERFHTVVGSAALDLRPFPEPSQYTKTLNEVVHDQFATAGPIHQSDNVIGQAFAVSLWVSSPRLYPRV